MENEEQISSTQVTKYHLVMFQYGDAHICRLLAPEIQELLDEAIKTPKEQTEIDVWIDSRGGDAHGAYKLSLELRSRCRHLQAVVPDYAKSAATLLALGADAIYMGPSAELGPLDVQLQHHDRDDLTVSGLDVASSIESLALSAVKLAIGMGGDLVEYTGLQRREVLQSMLQFLAEFLKPAVSKIDPYLQHQAVNQLKVAERYASRMLVNRDLPADKHLAEERAKMLLWRLVNNYPTHGYVISREEARELGLPVLDAETHPRWQEIKEIHRNFMKQGETHLRVIEDAEFVKEQAPAPPLPHPKADTDHETSLLRETNAENGNKGSQSATSLRASGAHQH